MPRIYRARTKADRPKADWDDDVPLTPGLTVFEPDGSPQPTGLYDAQGNELVVMEEREPIGFMQLKEKS